MRIEKLCREDIPELLKLYEELVSANINLEMAEKKYLEIVNNEDYIILVAKDNKILGTVMGVCCKTMAFGDKNFLVVEDVIVSEDVRGQGIGRKLFESLDTFALEKNCAYAILVSSDFRTGAHTFYEKIGYTDGVKGFRKKYQ